MKREKETDKNLKQPIKEEQKKAPRSSAFNETRQGDKKQTTNPEEEAQMEQERKEAMTERD